MIYRKAIVADIPQIQLVRNAVKENRLSSPTLISDALCEEFITQRGNGWVCEIRGHVAGFAIVDLKENNVWALFVHPDHEKKGIGRQLHELMLNWYFDLTKETLWLGTAPNTRAEQFYRKAGWRPDGINGDKELKFEMTYALWEKKQRSYFSTL